MSIQYHKKDLVLFSDAAGEQEKAHMFSFYEILQKNLKTPFNDNHMYDFVNMFICLFFYSTTHVMTKLSSPWLRILEDILPKLF